MMQEIDDRHRVVEKSSFAEIAGARQADLVANQVSVTRRNPNGTEGIVTTTYPAGIAIVRRR
jgi:hypothetical protein